MERIRGKVKMGVNEAVMDRWGVVILAKVAESYVPRVPH